LAALLAHEDNKTRGKEHMQRAVAAIFLISLLALGGCSRLGGNRAAANGNDMRVGTEIGYQAATNSNIDAQSTALSDIGGFLGRKTITKLSAKDQTEAASAQYYALQFGRPGAPRSWHGDSGANGQVSVGPYVRVNSLDCRDFTHRVTVGGASYENTGTACREADGNWDVVAQ
jgi:surface antigen